MPPSCSLKKKLGFPVIEKASVRKEGGGFVFHLCRPALVLHPCNRTPPRWAGTCRRKGDTLHRQQKGQRHMPALKWGRKKLFLGNSHIINVSSCSALQDLICYLQVWWDLSVLRNIWGFRTFLTTKQTVCCYYDKRGHYLCVKLHLCTEQLGVKTHQLSIPVMEVALSTDQKELNPKISLEFL